jgi:hypothetical protein
MSLRIPSSSTTSGTPLVGLPVQNTDTMRLTGQTSVAQNTCKNDFKHLLTSSMNRTWCVAFVDDHKQGNEPCTHK